MVPLMERANGRKHDALAGLDPRLQYAVWWHGGVRKNPQDKKVPLVRVWLRELLPMGGYGFELTRDVGINHLGQLRIGTVWRAGRCSAQLSFEQQTFRVRLGQHRMSSQAQWGREHGRHLLDESVYPLPFKDRDRSKVLIFNEIAGCRSVLVPSLEFFTRCYGRSAEVNRVLATYRWEEVADRLLLPCIWETLPGHWGVALPAVANNDDAVLLAHLHHDPFAIAAAKRIYAELDIGFENSSWVFPSIGPWFDEEVELIVGGMWLDAQRTRFLGLRVVGCSLPTGPDIDARRVQNPGPAEVPAGGDAPETTWSGGRLQASDVERLGVGLTAAQPPDHVSGRAEFMDDDFVIPGRQRVVHFRHLAEAQTRPVPGDGADDMETASTGERQGGPSGTGKATIHSRLVLGSEGALRDVWNALLYLQDHHGDLVHSLAWYTTDSGLQDAGSAQGPMLEPLSPYTEEEERLVRKDRSRIYLDYAAGITRSLLIARVLTPGAEVFLFELERREVKTAENDGPGKKEDNFSGLVICRPPGAALREWIRDLVNAIRLECGVMKRVLFNPLTRSASDRMDDYRRSSSKADAISGHSTVINALEKVGVHLPRDAEG